MLKKCCVSKNKVICSKREKQLAVHHNKLCVIVHHTSLDGGREGVVAGHAELGVGVHRLEHLRQKTGRLIFLSKLIVRTAKVEFSC